MGLLKVTACRRYQSAGARRREGQGHLQRQNVPRLIFQSRYRRCSIAAAGKQCHGRRKGGGLAYGLYKTLPST